MAPDSVDTVNLHVYSFVARHDHFTPAEGNQQIKQVGEDMQKMFPSCSYQGRTVQLNWQIDSHPNQFAGLPDKDKLSLYDFVLGIFNVDPARRLETELLAKNECNPITTNKDFKGKFVVVMPYDKKLLNPHRVDIPKAGIIQMTIKDTFKDNYFKDPDTIIPFAYRQDKLAENALDKAHQWHFINGQDVDQAIQAIVKDRLPKIADKKPNPILDVAKDFLPACKQDDQLPIINKQIPIADKQDPVVNIAKDVPPVPKQDEEKNIPVQPQTKVSLLTRLVHLVGAILPSLAAAVTTLAMRILYPKLKEIQIIGIGVTAGTVMHLGINFFRKA